MKASEKHALLIQKFKKTPWEQLLDGFMAGVPGRPEYLMFKAEDWQTCGVGEALKDVGVASSMQVCARRHRLRDMGEKFADHIEHQDYIRAAMVYGAIAEYCTTHRKALQNLEDRILREDCHRITA